MKIENEYFCKNSKRFYFLNLQGVSLVPVKMYELQYGPRSFQKWAKNGIK